MIRRRRASSPAHRTHRLARSCAAGSPHRMMHCSVCVAWQAHRLGSCRWTGSAASSLMGRFALCPRWGIAAMGWRPARSSPRRRTPPACHLPRHQARGNSGGARGPRCGLPATPPPSLPVPATAAARRPWAPGCRAPHGSRLARCAGAVSPGSFIRARDHVALAHIQVSA